MYIVQLKNSHNEMWEAMPHKFWLAALSLFCSPAAVLALVYPTQMPPSPGPFRKGHGNCWKHTLCLVQSL